MKLSIINISLIAFLLILSIGPAIAADLPAVGETLPDFTLPVPDNLDHRNYLGLAGEGKKFSVPDIADPVVVIEIFSMYCPHCQREAPAINQFYELIQKDPNLKGRVRLLGIGVGNSQFEVDYFQKTYDIPFPLFPDPDFAIHGIMGEPRTPYFVVIQKTANGGHRIVYSKLGGFGTPSAFLDLILETCLR